MRRPHATRCSALPILLLALAASGCAGPGRPREGTASPAAASEAPVPVPNLFDAVRQVELYIDSGRYRADVAAVVAEAEAYLEERARSVARPAIVLDIDETSLSNWPAYRLNGWARITNGGCDLELGPCGLRTWQGLARSEALEPTLALAQRAKALGVAVFFISGRPSKLREATETNLRAQGFEWDDLTILPDGASFPSAVDFKAPARRRITENGYTILVNVGDQDSDLAGGYAERTFKLPNPVYYLP